MYPVITPEGTIVKIDGNEILCATEEEAYEMMDNIRETWTIR